MTTIRNFMRRGFRALLVVPMVALAPACTDLTEVPDDALTPGNAFKTEAEILAGVASVYAGLRGTHWGVYNLSEITTNEVIVPTRGNDWYDNGRWLEIHRHGWTANSGSALDDMNGTWNDLFSGVARSNLMLGVMEAQPASTQRDQTIAELRTLRAWYYYLLLDLFGSVPLVTSTEVQQNPNVARDSLFRFIEAELKDARDDLPLSWPTSQYGRVTRGAANAILASLYINAEVYTGTLTATSFTKGTPRWADARDAADAVISSGQYALASDWKSAFRGNNSTNAEAVKENIFVVNYTDVAGLGMNFPMRTLHYYHVTTGGGGPWNGFAAVAETYTAFDALDIRRDSTFLVGQQYSFDDGRALTDRSNVDPLIYTVEIANADAATEGEGPRYNKFPPLSNAPSGDAHPNDYPFFRIAEMYLIKAEALNELDQAAAALLELNRVRERAFDPNKPLVIAGKTAIRDAIFNERLFEFAGEGKRRRDLIRQGTYTAARHFKPAETPIYKILFPIPQTQIQSNPLLQQNPGY
jgi:starch-binding outer membrane protein, SusD/RagB family